MGPDAGKQSEEILQLKQRWGEELLILAHHYQRHDVVRVADRLGDSYELARAAAEAKQARFIVYCGVRFMAEAAEVLRTPDQVVIHPVESAGCPLADFATLQTVEHALSRLQATRGADAVMPLVYMNSSAAIKALVGRSGGCVCTSSNAGRAFSWALKQRPVVLFLPDRHLGENTVAQIGIEPDRVAVWDPAREDGGLTPERMQRVQVVLWRGHCHVHTAFEPHDIAFVRHQYPDAQVLVHPECSRDVVLASDGSGSTSFLVQRVGDAQPGSRWVIGTEAHLVDRLAAEHPDRMVVPLRRSVCEDMDRIGLGDVLRSLQGLSHSPSLRMADEIKDGARLALERMLEIG